MHTYPYIQQVELSFKNGEVILVYGDMDEDGFYMGELDGVRGLVPSNFLAEAPEQYSNQTNSAQRNQAISGTNAAMSSAVGAVASNAVNRNANRGQGQGARGPPPPPRDNMIGSNNVGSVSGTGIGVSNNMNQMNQRTGSLRKGM